jgi:hypothetical protein
MAKDSIHRWQFRAKFRAGFYSWKGSASASKNLRAAVSEIRKGYKNDPLEAVEATIYLMTCFWPAFRGIDDSGGALGNAIRAAIDKLVPLLIAAPADDELRKAWTLRLFEAIRADGIDHLSTLVEQWGTICVTDALRAYWIDELLPDTARAMRSRRDDYYYFCGTDACLSCLLESGRYDELRRLLDLDDPPFWSYESYWAQALVRQGRVDDALHHACSLLSEDDDLKDNLAVYCPEALAINRFCEATLYDAGRKREAYEQYALRAQPDMTYLAHFRSLVKRYPEYEPREILLDLMEKSGRPKQAWFSSARECQWYDVALQCAESGPVSPSTLATAARDTLESHPEFAWRVSLLAIKYLLVDYTKVDEHDVVVAVRQLVQGASNAGVLLEALATLQQVLALRKKAQKVPTLVQNELKRLGVSTQRQ